jgi:hypothetical protein
MKQYKNYVRTPSEYPPSQVCIACGEDKPLEAFRRQTGQGSKYGRQSKCKMCMIAREQERREKKRGRISREELIKNKQIMTQRVSLQRVSLQRFFGFTLEQYNAMWETQGGVCAICGRPETNGKRLAVDHDHTAGTVRALLCHGCNLGIALFEENISYMQAAIGYLHKFQPWDM